MKSELFNEKREVSKVSRLYSSKACCPWPHAHYKPNSLCLFIFLFYFCISREYDVSKISCLELSDMKCLRMYYRGIRLVVNFSLPKVIYCKLLLFFSCLLI